MYPNATQRVVLCYELMEEIFRQLRPPSYIQNNLQPENSLVDGHQLGIVTEHKLRLRALAAAARASKAISDHALDNLWHTLYTPFVLLKTLPTFCAREPMNVSISISSNLR